MSKAKDLIFSATCGGEILRLRLRMTIVTQSLSGEGWDEGDAQIDAPHLDPAATWGDK
jgi:hypothetical protein